jgi:hypothetical protein
VAEIRPRKLVRDGTPNAWTEFEVRVAQGPHTIGNTGDGEYPTLYGYAWMVVITDDDQVKLFQAKQGGQPWPITGNPANADWVETGTSEFTGLPHPVSEIRHIALAFDQAARPMIAYERNNEVWVRQWDALTNQYVMRGPFAGVDPVLVCDATVFYYIPDSDVVVFYLSPDRLALKNRVQRELFATEYTVHTFPNPVILDQVLSTPYQVGLVGVTDAVKNATGFAIFSYTYPVYLKDVLGQAAFAAPTTGDYIPVVVIYDAGMETLGAAFAAPNTGAYIPIVVIQDLGTETLGQATFAAPATGAYIPVVVVRDLGMDTLGSAAFAAPTTGNYVLVVVVVDLTASQYTGGLGYENLGSATFSAPTTGSYELA